MSKVSIKEARRNFKSLLDRAAAGEEVTILRRGKEVACIAPAKGKRKRLPELGPFRSSISLKGKSLSREVVRARRKERY